MASYLKTLGNRLLRRLQPDTRPASPKGASPVLNKVLTDRPPLRKPETRDGQADANVAALPAGSKIVSNGNGKNVYAGELRPLDSEDMLKMLDEPSLALEDEAPAFDPYNTGSYDRSGSWEKIRRDRYR